MEFRNMFKLFKSKEAAARRDEGVQPEAAQAAASAASSEDKYLERLRVMVTEADDARAMSDLINAFTFTLARIAGQYGNPYVAGDIVKRFGYFLCRVEEYKTAQAEAAKAKASGRPLN